MPSDFQELFGEDEAIGRNPEHSLFAPNRLDILLDLLLRKRGVVGPRRHLLKHGPDLINLLRHLVEVRIAMAPETIDNVRTTVTPSLHRKIIFFVFVDFEHEIGLIELHLVKTVEVEECLYQGLVLCLISEGSFIDRYHLNKRGRTP